MSIEAEAVRIARKLLQAQRKRRKKLARLRETLEGVEWGRVPRPTFDESRQGLRDMVRKESNPRLVAARLVEILTMYGDQFFVELFPEFASLASESGG